MSVLGAILLILAGLAIMAFGIFLFYAWLPFLYAVALLLARPANARFPSWARMLNTSPFGARRTAVRAEHAPRLLKS